MWWWCVPERLSTRVLEQLKHPSTVVVFSAVSAFEITLKHRLGKLPLASAITDNLEQRAVEEGWELLPISVRHALIPHPKEALARHPWL